MIIGISIPSLIAIFGSLLTYEYISDVQKRQGYQKIADNINADVLEVRRNEKNFIHFKDAAHLDYLHKAVSLLSRTVRNVSPLTVKEIGEEEFSLLQQTIEEYPVFVNDLYSSYREEIEVTGNVRREGRKLEAFITEGSHASELTTSFILHLRLMEKNYMLFHNRESYLKLNDALSKLKNITPICYRCNPYIEAVHGLFSSYQRTDSILEELQSVGNRIEKVTGRIAARERERIESFIVKTKRLLMIALVLLCTSGPLFIYKTAGYIVAPIRRLSEITKKIADGDMNLRAPIREHDETYFLAVSFNKMLDKLQLTYQSLEKSMKLLNEKQAQLVDSEKRASLGLLVSGVAHELNNPLYNISLTGEAMRDSLDDLSREEMAEYIEDILSQGKRARHIIDDLLDFARARKSTVMEKQNIVKVLRESINLVASQMRMSNIELKQDIAGPDIYMTGNQSKLEQIFVSIFTNAIQAMKAMKAVGTLHISVRTDDDKYVIIQISDTGQGIAPDDLKNIFEPFYTTKPVGEGTGLGLSVCRSLVQEHKGEIEAESELGRGTTFTIKFPKYASV